MSAKKIVSAFALGALLLTAGVVSAQTTTPTTTIPTTPGVPSTGSGGELATNVLLLATTAGLALAGGVYLARRFARE